MIGLELPVCSLFFSVLLFITYFLKKRINLVEIKIYSIMLICSVIDSFIVSCLRIIALYDVSHYLKAISILNKIDFIQLIGISTCLFVYILYISFKIIRDNYKKIFKIIFFFDVLIIIIMLFLKVNVISSNSNLSVAGSSINITYGICALYIISSIIITIILFAFKKAEFDKRYIPIFVVVFLFLFLFFIYSQNPYLIVISITLTFINYLMYFTIENPDLRLVEEIKAAKDKTDKTNVDKSNFLFTITQEVRNRVQEMNGYISEAFYADNPEKIKEILYKLQTSLASANTMINNTLDINEEDIIKIEKRDTKYNIKNLINGVVLLAKPTVNKEVDFKVSIDNNIPEILYGDSIKIKQIIYTILDNSLKHTSKGFIELRIDSFIKYEICRLIITLEDSGCGIDNDELTKIFAQSSHNDYLTKNLSLNSVNKIVKLIGGTFNITSKINHGTKIIITIDQYIPEEDKNNQVTEYIKTLNVPKVLIVDENVNNLEKIKKMFANEKIYIDTVILGEQCLRKLRNGEDFDLIIMDYDMPKLNGLEIYNKLKAEGYNIPVIITTSSEDEKVKEKYKNFGIYDVIKKPIEKEEIKKVIEYLNSNKTV